MTAAGGFRTVGGMPHRQFRGRGLDTAWPDGRGDGSEAATGQGRALWWVVWAKL